VYNPVVYDISITTDTDYPNLVEIALLDKNGAIIEGGQFNLQDFLAVVLEFYNDNI
jgi:hypothetical protein